MLFLKCINDNWSQYWVPQFWETTHYCAGSVLGTSVLRVHSVLCSVLSAQYWELYTKCSVQSVLYRIMQSGSIGSIGSIRVNWVEAHSVLINSTEQSVLGPQYWVLCTKCSVHSVLNWVFCAEGSVLSAQYWVTITECASTQLTPVNPDRPQLTLFVPIWSRLTRIDLDWPPLALVGPGWQ